MGQMFNYITCDEFERVVCGQQMCFTLNFDDLLFWAHVLQFFDIHEFFVCHVWPEELPLYKVVLWLWSKWPATKDGVSGTRIVPEVLAVHASEQRHRCMSLGQSVCVCQLRSWHSWCLRSAWLVFSRVPLPYDAYVCDVRCYLPRWRVVSLTTWNNACQCFYGSSWLIWRCQRQSPQQVSRLRWNWCLHCSPLDGTGRRWLST